MVDIKHVKYTELIRELQVLGAEEVQRRCIQKGSWKRKTAEKWLVEQNFRRLEKRLFAIEDTLVDIHQLLEKFLVSR